jgi:hypothetical protein
MATNDFDTEMAELFDLRDMLTTELRATGNHALADELINGFQRIQDAMP